jgi:uncharacterized repeat protein (TIGR01451 family)
MTVNDLRSLAPPAGVAAGDTNLVWLTQWLVPASPSCTDTTLEGACPTGGENFFVYAESNGGGAPTCWTGESATFDSGAAVGPALTYPGTTQLDPGACSVVQGAPGTISIDVPISDVTLQDADKFDDTLYSVTSSTMTSAAKFESNPPTFVDVGGVLFNLVDVVRAYNANFNTADLSVRLTDSPDPVKKDKPLTYTATVQNAGPAAASGVALTDKLPKGVELKSLKTTQGTCKGTNVSGVITVNCSLGAMAAGGSATVTMVVGRLPAGTITDTASVTAQSPADPNSADNSATVTTTVTS